MLTVDCPLRTKFIHEFWELIFKKDFCGGVDTAGDIFLSANSRICSSSLKNFSRRTELRHSQIRAGQGGVQCNRLNLLPPDNKWKSCTITGFGKEETLEAIFSNLTAFFEETGVIPKH